MDDRWPSYTDGIRGSADRSKGIENVEYPNTYNTDSYVNDSFMVNLMGNPIGNSTALLTDSSIYSIHNRDLSYANPNNYENTNYKSNANQMSRNNYKTDLNTNINNDQLRYPFFGQPFNNNSWINEYDPLLNIKTGNNLNGKNNHVTISTSLSSVGGDTLQDWKIPEPTTPIQDANIFMDSTIKHSETNKVDVGIPFAPENYIEASDIDAKSVNIAPPSEISYDRSTFSNNRNFEPLTTSLGDYVDNGSFRWDFLMKPGTEADKLKSFKHLISISTESEIPSIISYLIQLISLRSTYRVFAIKALTITLASHPEIFTLSFQLVYVEKLFIHPSLDDLAASFLRLLMSNMANIEANDKSINFPEAARNYISKIIQICCSRSECNDINLLGSSRLRDWICTFWYEMPITLEGINIGQVCLSWINNRYDALYMKDGPFALLVRERDSRGPLGLSWLFENFIQIVFRHSSNLSIDFQHVILMCGVKSKNSKRISYSECIHSYFTKYKASVKREVGEGGNALLKYYSHILDVWIALLCIPWPPRHPNTPHLQLLSHFFQFIVQEESLNPIAKSQQLSLVKAVVCISLSRIASPINAEDAALQVITLLLHGSKPFVHEQMAPQVLSGVSNFIRRRLFLWRSVDSGISQQTIQTVQTLYDIINQVAGPSETNDGDLNDMFTQFVPNQHQPLFPRSNVFNQDINDNNDDLSNDIIEHVYSSREGIDGLNRLKIFLNMHPNIINGYNDGNLPDLKNTQHMNPNEEPTFFFDTDPNANNNNNKRGVEPPVPAPGLKNLGNTCYYNSILQALYHTDDFLSILFNCHDNPDAKMMNHGFYKGLLKVFKKMLTSGKEHVNPSSSYKLLPSQFKNKCQHDTTEVARYILDELGCDKLSIWKGLFVGLVIQRIKCKCGYVSDTNQTIIDFSFPLAAVAEDEEASIQSLMDGFMKKEKLAGDNKYFCNRCNKNRKAEKWNVIASPPIHLMVILNRNLWEANKGTPEKILRHVHINHMLTLCGFTYYLYGSIIHQGFSTDSGHYYFVGTRSDTVKYPERWYKMDDTNAIRIGPEYIEETSSDQSNTHVPYVLFYRCNQADVSPNIYL